MLMILLLRILRIVRIPCNVHLDSWNSRPSISLHSIRGMSDKEMLAAMKSETTLRGMINQHRNLHSAGMDAIKFKISSTPTGS